MKKGYVKGKFKFFSVKEIKNVIIREEYLAILMIFSKGGQKCHYQTGITLTILMTF